MITDEPSLKDALLELSASIEASITQFNMSIDMATNAKLVQANASIDDFPTLPVIWISRCVGEITIGNEIITVDTLEK